MKKGEDQIAKENSDDMSSERMKSDFQKPSVIDIQTVTVASNVNQVPLS